jgi:hypothetical protein
MKTSRDYRVIIELTGKQNKEFLLIIQLKNLYRIVYSQNTKYGSNKHKHGKG